ncbi:MAG: NAD-dependent deacylase [Bacteroidia bacterium]|nr:NAD-dependent deacylase [Bacteroidia bacterium]MCZ2247568.1 NAD-dependent deacylase [Bacteroidia bacterium]
MKHIVFFTGAGVSAESGLKTFRDSDGLWENYRIEEVATPDAWRRNPKMVLEFYNMRRKQCLEAKPNASHKMIASLQKQFKVSVITQNIDNLHERAGSKHVLHLHGEITKSRSTVDSSLVYNILGSELNIGDTCEKGSQLRPHIVWFGEGVPMMEEAIDIVERADVFVVIGSSLLVYPAAGLIHYVDSITPKFIIDPFVPSTAGIKNIICIEKTAVEGTTLLEQHLQKFL